MSLGVRGEPLEARSQANIPTTWGGSDGVRARANGWPSLDRRDQRGRLAEPGLDGVPTVYRYSDRVRHDQRSRAENEPLAPNQVTKPARLAASSMRATASGSRMERSDPASSSGLPRHSRAMSRAGTCGSARSSRRRRLTSLMP